MPSSSEHLDASPFSRRTWNNSVCPMNPMPSLGKLIFNYHSAVVPAFGDAHERYDELLNAALRNCVNIRAFRWWASEEISAPTLRSLISLKKLRTLGLRLKRIEPEMLTEMLDSLLGLDEITFRDVPELLAPGVISWIGRMSTLQSLTIEVTS